MNDNQTDVTTKVNEFYNIMPFNYTGNIANFSEMIKAHNAIKINYPNVHDLLENSNISSLIDIGCGTGWFVNSIPYYYDIKISAVDLCLPALERTKAIATELGIAGYVETMPLRRFEWLQT